MKIQYVRHENRQPYGVMVAVKNEATGTVHVGYSLLSEGDQFDKGLGVTIARQRALRARRNTVPAKIESQFRDFVDHLHGRKEYQGWRLPAPDDFEYVGPEKRRK